MNWQERADRFFSHINHPGIEVDSDPCWDWTGPLNKYGYGRFSYKGTRELAHRVSYEMFIGPITEQTLDHLCRNRKCVNPYHLEPVSISENVKRGDAGKYQQNPTCAKGHTYDRFYVTRRGTQTRQCSICNKERSKEYYYRNKAPVNRGGERTL